MVAYKNFKTKEKSSCGRGRLRELFIAKFKSQFKRGFTKVVVTRAGRFREWSQAKESFDCIPEGVPALTTELAEFVA